MEFEPIKMITEWTPTFITTVIVFAIYYGINKVLQLKTSGKSNMLFLRAIILFIVTLLGFVFIILSAPINDGVKGQIMSLFGIIISAGLAISSATFISNALSGIMLRSVNHYKIGDFVRVGDIFGRVTERGFFNTEIQTESRDLISVPNSHLANNPVKVIRSSGTFVTAECSLGYDVNQNSIKKALVQATENAGLKDGFVHVQELGDFSVVYKTFGFLEEVKTIISAKSRLHCCMLDSLHEAGIEIVSPTFMNQRQVNDTMFIPSKMNDQLSKQMEKVEQKIFDKADEAESIEDTKENLKTVKEELSQLSEKLKNTDNESVKNQIQAQIDKYEKLKKRLEDVVGNKVEELKSKE